VQQDKGGRSGRKIREKYFLFLMQEIGIKIPFFLS
jgi:hypothetical protein